ncbi:MAG: hypothetical protein JWP94_1522 [Mucilaginibacter sp.]|nr:hypothetical protein [Mucilaginibacter sp.]
MAVSLLTLTGFSAKVNDGVVNYFDIPETISFNKLDYKLAWSSHPNTIYYKQEYVPAGDTVTRFQDMIMIDFIQIGLPVKAAVEAQVKTIIERKKTDKVCNYQVLKKSDDDLILDFVMSDYSSADNVVEWSAYHYSQYTDKAGHKGVLLFGVSHRAYKDQIIPFMTSLLKYKTDNLKALSTFPVPEIQIK